jgi:hypothetical protein
MAPQAATGVESRTMQAWEIVDVKRRPAARA